MNWLRRFWWKLVHKRRDGLTWVRVYRYAAARFQEGLELGRAEAAGKLSPRTVMYPVLKDGSPAAYWIGENDLTPAMDQTFDVEQRLVPTTRAEDGVRADTPEWKEARYKAVDLGSELQDLFFYGE